MRQFAERELAIRAALGAGRLRVARQLLTESLAIAAIGGAAGILTAVWCSTLLRAALPADLIGAADIRVDLRVLAFAVSAVGLAALLAGLFPAVGASRTNLHGALLDRGAAGTLRTRRRALGALVVAEFALALVLVIGAGLMIRTFANLSTENPGFARAGVLSLSVSPPSSYDGPASRRFWRELLERVDALPGIRKRRGDTPVATWPQQLGQCVAHRGPAAPAGRPASGDRLAQHDARLLRNTANPAASRPALHGSGTRGRRAGRRHQRDSGKALLRGRDPVGRRVRTPAFEGGDWARIVGVVGDTKDQTLAAPARPQMYRLQAPFIPVMTLMVRTVGDPLQLVGPIREIVRAIDMDVALGNAQPLERVVGDSIAQPRMLTALLFGFGLLALLLGAVGLYGVMAYVAVQRTREFGVRLALGARTHEVLGLVARDALRLVAMGVTVGLLGALALSRVVKSQLYDVLAGRPVRVRRRRGGSRRGGVRRRIGARSARRAHESDGGPALGIGHMTRTDTMVTHTGGCHCGRVRFEVTAPARLQVSDCNCSICSKSGYLHLIVPKSRFKLLSGEDWLTTYEFNTRTAKHLFCSACGIKSFYVPRSLSGRLQRQRALLWTRDCRGDDGRPRRTARTGNKRTPPVTANRSNEPERYEVRYIPPLTAIVCPVM